MKMLPSKIFIAGHTWLIGSGAMRRFGGGPKFAVMTTTHRELELQDPRAVEKCFNRTSPDYVILAAGKVGGIMENRSFPADFINANLAIQLNVLAAAHRVGVKKLLLFALSCMYLRECP